MRDSGQSQRLDKWLWFARMARTRSAAARLIEAGYIRVNGQRALQCSKLVKLGDVLTIALERDVRILRVIAIADRRGPFEQAQNLYEFCAPETTAIRQS